MSLDVTIIDYGVGNLLSVTRAFEVIGAQALVTSDPDEISRADRLILPGVGAFADGMDQLKNRDLLAPIKSFVNAGKPFLGICLGMQMLFASSEEFGDYAGLDLIAGKVIKIPSFCADGKKHKVPHIGWNELHSNAGVPWQGSILAGTRSGESFYFVHSFMAQPANAKNVLATCDYDGTKIVGAVQHGNIYGCQFHPEKSGRSGIRVLESFLKL